MGLAQITRGNKIPDEVNIVVEIPMRNTSIKYEIDKASGAIFVDRFISTPMYYPCNYGYIPNTLSQDGDPLDALVISPFSINPGIVICCRPIGILNVEDNSGIDTKLITVPIDKISPLYTHITTIQDLPECTLNQIHHFFSHYKDLEQGKWVRVEHWSDVNAAKAEILVCTQRYDTNS